MADTIVDIPGVGRVSFPDSMTESEINAAAARLYDEAQGGSGSSGPATAGLLAAAAPTALAAGKRMAEQIATSPIPGKLAKSPLAQRAATQAGKALTAVGRGSRIASPILILSQLAQGDLTGAAKMAAGSAATSAVTKYGPQAIKAAPRTIQSLAARAAQTLPASPGAMGAGAGLAVPILFLKALEADANRKPAIDPESDTPASTILRGFQTLAGQR